MSEKISLEDKIKKILIIRTDRIGDLVCTIPSIITVKEYFSHATITALLSPVNGELVFNTGLIDEIIIWNKNALPAEKQSIINKLGEKRFDLVLVFSPYTESYKLAADTKAPIRAGIVVKTRFLTRLFSFFWLTHTFLLNEFNETSFDVLHEIEKGFALLGKIGIKDFKKEIVLPLPEKIIRECRKIIKEHSIKAQKGIIALPLCRRYMGAGWTVEDLQRFAEEIRKSFPDYLLFITFGSEEREEGEFLEKIFHNTYGILIKGLLPLQLWAAFMQNMSLVITIDSSPVHLAASGKVPSVVLYPKNIYHLCHQEWKPWQVKSRQLIMKDFNETIKDIIPAVESLLKEMD